ncbi:MAG: hypothetical protein ACI85K_002193 [Hyphomicrobiaceae bacterium]|jgi:hypothetical protein
MKRPHMLFACLLTCLLPSIAAQQRLPTATDAIDLRITDKLGGPLQNARITLRGWVKGSDRYRVIAGQTTRTLEPKQITGDYARIGQLPAGEFIWFVEADGFALTVSKKFALPSKKPRRLTVRMKSGVTIEGVVAGPNGAALANAVDSTSSQDGRNQHPFAVMMERMMVDPITITQTTTAADGSYRFANIARGKHRITARHVAYAPGDCDVTVTATRAHKAPTIRVPVGTALSGIVTLTNQRIPNAVVVLHSIAKNAKGKFPHLDVYLTTTTDQEGRFELPRVVPGAYQLSAHEPGDPLAMAQQQAKSKHSVQVLAKPADETQTELIVLTR